MNDSTEELPNCHLYLKMAIKVLILLFGLHIGHIDCDFCQGIPSGDYPHPDCNKFIRCGNAGTDVIKCPGNLHFDASNKICNWPLRASCRSSNVVVLSKTVAAGKTEIGTPTFSTMSASNAAQDAAQDTTSTTTATMTTTSIMTTTATMTTAATVTTTGQQTLTASTVFPFTTGTTLTYTASSTPNTRSSILSTDRGIDTASLRDSLSPTSASELRNIFTMATTTQTVQETIASSSCSCICSCTEQPESEQTRYLACRMKRGFSDCQLHELGSLFDAMEPTPP